MPKTQLVEVIEFEWPGLFRSNNARNDKTIVTALKLAGLDPSLARYYRIAATARGMVAKRVKPGQYYFLVVDRPNNIPFRWPENNESAPSHTEEVIQEALKIAGYELLDSEDYYITNVAGTVALSIKPGDGLVEPGEDYFLCLI